MFSRVLLLLLVGTRLFSQGLSDSIAFSVNLDEYVVTAQYEPTHYKSAIHRIGIIDSKTIKSRGALTLDQALVTSPSIRIYNDPILGTSVRMRGIGSRNVAILIDGIPTIGRLGGAIDISQISMQNVERIEVVEGALSNIYGSNAAGGVINIITKKNQLKKWDMNLNAQLESIGQENYDFRIARRFNKLLIDAHGRYFQYDQFPMDSMRMVDKVLLADSSEVLQDRYPFNPKEQYGMGGLVRYDFDDESFVLLKYDLNDEEVKDFGVEKRPQFNPYANDRFYHTRRSDLSLNFKKKWSDKWTVDIKSAFNRYDRIVDEKRYYLETMEFDSLLQFSDTTQFDLFFNTGILYYTINENWTAIGGMNYLVERGSGDRVIDRGSEDSTTVSFSEYAPFVDLKYKGIKNLDISVSGRYTVHSIYGSNFTPALHMKYEFSDQLSLRAGYAQGFRSPSLKELYMEFIDVSHHIIGNQDLKPETSHDWQLTLDYAPFEYLNLSANAYHTIVQDRIGLFEYETLKFRYENINEYKVWGIQPELKFNLKSLDIRSSATIGYWATNVDSDEAPTYGEVLDVNNSISYTIPKSHTILSLNHRHVGKQPNYRLSSEDELEVRTISSYDLLDASVSQAFLEKRLTLTAGARNVLDVQNTNISGSTSGSAHGGLGRNIVSQGRNWFVSLGVDL